MSSGRGEALPADPVRIAIDGLGSSGEGHGLWGDRTVWIPNTAPGDEVTARLSPRGRLLLGELEEVQVPSPFRREAPCPLAGRCGGCDWLHLTDDFQGAAKQRRVLDTLVQVGQLDIDTIQVRPLVRPAANLGYRRRAALHVGPQGLFYFARRTHAPVPLQACPALVPSLQSLLTPLSELLIPHAKRVNQVLLAAEGDATAAALIFSSGANSVRQELGEKLLRLGIQGVVLQSEEPGGAAPAVLGHPELRSEAVGAPGVALYTRPDAFAQAHAEENAALVSAALDMLAPEGTERLLELFGGNGNFTFGLARLAREVWMVEGSRVSSLLARRSADEGGVKNVRLVLGEVGAVVSGLCQEKQAFDAILADPPRTGARDLGRWALELGARRVLYVACDPEALARDGRRLVAAGFRPQSLRVMDLFPQTHHTEALLLFRR